MLLPPMRNSRTDTYCVGGGGGQQSCHNAKDVDKAFYDEAGSML